jgi:peptidoglycan-N-acetylglucosamine deacetylase
VFHYLRARRQASVARRPLLLRPAIALLAVAGLVLGSGALAAAAPAPGETHTVASGDTLSGIAERYGVPLRTVFALNGLGPSSVIHPGDVIRLTGEAAEPGTPPPAEGPPAARSHTVRLGDTLGRIAASYGVPLATVFELNGLGWSSIIRPGDVIRLPGEAPAPHPRSEVPSAGRSHTVRPGDTLGQIAARNGVALDAVLQLNGLDRSSLIFPGDVLRLPAGDSGGAGSGGSAPPAVAQDPLRTGPNATSRVILTYDDCPRNLDAFTDVVSWAGSNGIGLVIAPTGHCISAFQSRHGVDIAALARTHGQYVINHSVSHRDLTTLSCADGAGELGAPGVVTNFGRPPFGALDSDAYCAYAQVGMNPWLWNVDTRDWTGKSEWEVVASVVDGARPGSTVLMHLQWNGFSPSALGQMRDGLAARGMELCRPYSGTSPVELPQPLPC